jgi:hypothetical protein
VIEPQCDEFPFFATEQGGPHGGGTASLKIIPKKDNKQQGDLYGFDNPINFIRVCKMGSVGDTASDGRVLAEGDRFIALPIPDIKAINTIPTLCNGKNRSRRMTGPAPVLSDALLDVLHDRLEQHAPGHVAKLRPGLSSDEIESLGSDAGIRLSIDARRWWGWRDGIDRSSISTSSDRALGPKRGAAAPVRGARGHGQGAAARP